jgi:DNA-binding transcriptional regulator GbsR (MarR family)
MKAKKSADSNRLKKLLMELDQAETKGDRKERAENILKLIRNKQIETDIDEMLDRHAKLCAKVFLDKIFRAIISNK